MGTPGDEDYYSRSVRKIDNGYLVCESSNGKYTEKFSPTKPEEGKARSAAPQANPLRAAVEAINRTDGRKPNGPGKAK